MPGGIQQAGKKNEKDKDKKEEEDDEESESELMPRPMFGASADSRCVQWSRSSALSLLFYLLFSLPLSFIS